MTAEHPLVARYLERLNLALADMPPADRADVVQEIGQHITDATAAGKDLDAVLTSLGAADQLARAYQVELLLHPKQAGPSRTDRYLKLFGLVAIASLPTFVLVVVLGTVAIALTTTGLAVFAAGIVDAFGILPRWVQMDVQPWVAVAIGPILAVVGIVSGWALGLYVRFITRVVRRALPAR